MPLLIDDLDKRQEKYRHIAPLLEATYGHKPFKPHDGMDELISCILSQNTTDANRDKAFFALKARYQSWQAVQEAPLEELIEVVRPAGLAPSKAKNIQASLAEIYRQRGAYNIDFIATLPAQEAREWLMTLDGVGPKTASIVLCFGYGMEAFPVDTHVYRVGKRLGFLPEKISVENAHYWMEAVAPPSDYYAFHLQMIYHGRKVCKARNPKCQVCPLQAHCDYFTSGAYLSPESDGE